LFFNEGKMIKGIEMQVKYQEESKSGIMMQTIY